MPLLVPILIGLSLLPVSYKFPENPPTQYGIGLKFDGYLPLLGGTEGTAEVKLGLSVQGGSSEGGNFKAISDLTDMSLTFKGQKLPFTVDDVKKYFPKNTVTLTPEGKILTNDAPDIALPVRLPGLDVKRFPDITFLAVEFPQTGVEENKAWSYQKSFGDSTVNYDVTPTAVTGSKIEMDVKLSQSYSTLEDEAHSLVKDQKDAAYSVKTDVKGSGKVVFDPGQGLIRSVNIVADSNDVVTDLQSKKETRRKLKTTLTVALK